MALATGSVKWSDSRTFYPVGLAILGLFVAASLSRHLGIIAIFIEVAVILTVFVIQGGRLKFNPSRFAFFSVDVAGDAPISFGCLAN